MFNEKFGTDITISALKGYMQRNRFMSDKTGRFESDKSPWNAGITGENYFRHYDREKVQEHMKKVHAGNKKLFVGSERLIAGIPHVCVAEGRTRKYDKWVRKRVHVWEKHNGPVPTGHCVVHLDKNRMNCELSNLACVPKKYMGILAKNNWHTQDRETTSTAIKWCKLHFAIKEET